MLRLFVLVVSLLPFIIIGQENNPSKYIHIIVIGPQLAASSNKSVSHEYAVLNYNNPGKAASYKFLMHRNDRKYFGLSLNTCYREGNLTKGYTGLSSSNSVRGTFRLQRADLGLHLARAFGKKSNCFFSWGIYFGGVVTQTSSGYQSSWALSNTGNHSGSNELSHLSVIRTGHGGMSFDFYRQFCFYKSNFLICGINLLFESAEFSGAGIGKICNIFIGYKFGRNALAPTTSLTTE